MTDTKAQAIKFLAKLIGDIADDRAVLTGLSVSNESRFVSFHSIDGRTEYMRTGPTDQKITLEISR